MAIWRRDPEVDPATVGMDPAGLDALAGSLDDALAEGKMFHGASVAVHRRGKLVLEAGGGTARVRTGEPVDPETLFVIFSATKGVAALAMLMLYERRKLHYDEPVTKYWPEFASLVPEKAAVSIRHVMSHRAGFPFEPKGLVPKLWGDREAIARALIEVPLEFIPGERNAYHAQNFGHMVNELILRIDGRDCGTFAREEIFDPLGIEDFWIGLPADEALEARVAWCYNKLDPRPSAGQTGVTGDEGGGRADAEMQATGEVYEPDPSRPGEWPERRHPFNRVETWRAVLPASNGIATAKALSSFYAALAKQPPELVKRESLDAITAPTNRKSDKDDVIGFPIRWGTGFHMGFYGQGSTLRTFGHGGAGGQIAFADPERELSMAFLCNGQLAPELMIWRHHLQTMAFEACRD